MSFVSSMVEAWHDRNDAFSKRNWASTMPGCSISLGIRLFLLPDAKILVIVGNLHAIKNIVWDDNVPNKNGVIRNYLSILKPELKVFSICQCINNIWSDNAICYDITKNITSIAFDCVDNVLNCRLNILDSVAAKPMKTSLR